MRTDFHDYPLMAKNESIIISAYFHGAIISEPDNNYYESIMLPSDPLQ